MKNFKVKVKYLMLSASFFLLLASFTSAAIVPCGVSGQDYCKISDLAMLFKNTMAIALQIVSIFVVAMIVYTGFKLMTGKNKATELTDSKERMWKLATGFFIFFGGTALMVMILRAVGLNQQFIDALNFFIASTVNIFANNVYAVGDVNLLPNPLNMSNPLDVFALFLHLIIRWFIFPCIIFAWLYSGFLYVKAQGNPKEISEAHNWLWWTFLGTVIIMLAEGFFSVLHGTLTSIFSQI